jgi:hypothetical protein
MPRLGRSARASAAAASALLASILLPAPAPGSDSIQPGAYCPLPRAGEVPECLQPAREEYDDFFAAVDLGQVDEAESAQVEAVVAGGGASENAYLALSSLSYGYYRLAQRVAASPGADPAASARLKRWNALLARAYETSADDPRYREAVHAAVSDLHQRTQARVGCADAQGQPAKCDSTEAVLRGFDAAASEVGIRGALQRLLERILGPEDG